MSEILIKKGVFQAKIPRNKLIEVVETADGINFNMKDGITIMMVDYDMPLSAKNIMKNTSDSFKDKKLIFDLANYNHPVMVDAT